MLLFLLSFYLHYDLLNSEEINIAKFNENSLVDKHLQNLREAKSLMRDLDLEQTFKETSVLRVDKRDEELVFDDSSTNLLRKIRDGQKHQITKDHKKLPAEFLPSSQNHPHDRLLGLSPYSGPQAPPLVLESPLPNSIPPGHLLSLRNSIFPNLVVPQSLLSVNGPGHYLKRFSYSPSPTIKTSKIPSVRSQSPTPDPILPEHLISLRHSIFPDLMVPQSLLSINGPGHYIKRFSYSPSPTIKTSKRLVRSQSPSPEPIPPVTLKNSELRSGLPYPGHQLNPSNSIYPEPVVSRVLLSVYGPGRYLSSVSYSPSSTKTTSKRPQVFYKEAPLKVHFHDENTHELKTVSPVNTPSISNHALSARTHPGFTTPSQTMDVNVNPKTWLGDIASKILKVSNDHTAWSQSRERFTVPAPLKMVQARQHSLATGTANTTQLFMEDENGFLYVTLPEPTSEDPNKKSKPTIAGDVLHGKIQVPVLTTLSPKRVAYNNEMERLNEGYLMFFFIEMCRLIAVKSRSEVLEALFHMEMIYNKRSESGQLEWIGKPFKRVIRDLLMVPPGEHVVVVTQTRAAMMSRMLQERRHVLSHEVNSIIDHAEMFFMDEDGERLLHAMEQFRDFPNTTKTSYEICDALMENLLHPFRRESVSPRRQQLVDTINKALQERFPHFLRGPHGGTPTVGERPVEIRPRKRKRKRKRKRPLKQIPPDQPKFRSITTKRHRTGLNTRPTPAFLPPDYELRVWRQRYRRKQNMEEVLARHESSEALAEQRDCTHAICASTERP